MPGSRQAGAKKVESPLGDVVDTRMLPVEMTRTPSETRPGRMQPLARLPVFLSLQGKRALLAGGSEAAAWKAELLSAAGAQVAVYADDVCDGLVELANDPPGGAIVLHSAALERR